jgi:sugar/nucleoside kinase (ribokinase family)
VSGNSKVVGIGNAIVDVLADADDAFLERHGMTKGAMTLVDEERALQLYDGMTDRIECSGGSAANTIAGLASLGGDGAYVGKVRDDALGDLFTRDIREAGVAFDTTPATSGPSTARCMILVTPDAQRTMNTFLGASATLQPEDLDEQAISCAAITYLEGYLWDPPPAKEAFRRAADVAHQGGGRVALTLSDSFCVERHREDFQSLIESHIDILFANEAEAIALDRAESLEAAAANLRRRCDLAVITLGAEGSLILAGDEEVRVPAQPVAKVVDTTGAGDLFAGGFLHGLAAGRSLADCGRIGAIAAAEVISHFGARPNEPLDRLVASRMG